MPKALIFNEFGLNKLKITDRAAEHLEPGQVRVAVKAISLNYRDYLMVEGNYNPNIPMPLIPCSDGAGIVVEVAADVTEVQVGDHVCSTMLPSWDNQLPPSDIHKHTLGGPAHGMAAAERVLPEKALVIIPKTMAFEEAACLPVAGLTAWNALHVGKSVRPGSKVLLLGTGGVSMMALQLAKSMGAETIITSSSDEKLERAKSFGADHGVNYRKNPKWFRDVLKIAPDGVDTVVEVGGEGTFDQSVRCLKLGGSLALIGVLAGNASVNLTAVLMKRILVQGILVGSRGDFRAYLSYLEKHPLKPAIDQVFEGLEQTPDAFRRMSEGGHFGKLVVRI